MAEVDASKRTILVIGATGQQGGAVMRQLQRHNWRPRALTRDPAKPAVQALATAGVEIVAGDLTDSEAVERALDGVYGLFSSVCRPGMARKPALPNKHAWDWR